MVLKPDKQQNPLKGLLEPTAGLYPRVSCSVGLGQAQEFSNKFSGDAEVACLGTCFENHCLRDASRQPLGFRRIYVAWRTFEKKLFSSPHVV